jgi:tRNA-splicing ligase RtcB
MEVTGETLIKWGFKPGPWFKDALKAAQIASASGMGEPRLRDLVKAFEPAPIETISLNDAGFRAFRCAIEADNELEQNNVDAVKAHMRELMRLPTVRAGVVMPDACPSGSAPGTIPVGGVIATEGTIHPGMHSADICCSMAISIFSGDVGAKAILDAGSHITHFGPGGRPRGRQWMPPTHVMEAMDNNRFLNMDRSMSLAREHFGTQGDGNHFFYVGHLKSTGQVALVTHHGSRAPGGDLYKLGMKLAQAHTAKVCPEAGKHNAWLDLDSEDGAEYWNALQILRLWTKENHFAIHDAVAKVAGAPVSDRFWNEHNFVFLKDDMVFHAKGATPSYSGFSEDDEGLTLIPLNMAQPVLITRPSGVERGLGFAPHGAGRNFSRTAYMKQNAHLTAEEMLRQQTQGLDVRFYSGRPDVSELPGAYKDAEKVIAQIKKFNLCEVVDMVMPYGTIMAGDFPKPWLNKKR